MDRHRRQWLSEQWTSIGLVGLASAVVVVLGVGALGQSEPSPATTADSAPAPLLERRPLLPLTQDAKVLVIGDSYTSGYGAEPTDAGYAYRLPALTGWAVTVDGVGGTGYVYPGNAGQGTYRTRLSARPIGEDFDLVVLQGGSNDQRLLDDSEAEPVADGAPVALAEDQLDTEIAATVEAVHGRYPRAHVVLLGPVSLFSRLHGSKLQVDAALLDYANAHDEVRFISPGRDVWFVPGQSELVNPLLGHPNAAGYAVMADKLARALSRSFVMAAPPSSPVAPPLAAPAASVR